LFLRPAFCSPTPVLISFEMMGALSVGSQLLSPLAGIFSFFNVLSTADGHTKKVRRFTSCASPVLESSEDLFFRFAPPQYWPDFYRKRFPFLNDEICEVPFTPIRFSTFFSKPISLWSTPFPVLQRT